MIAVARAELYRLRTVRSWRLSLLAGALVAAAIGATGDEWAFGGIVGGIAFLTAVVGAGQHYQHRTSILVFLAQPRRIAVLAGQTIAYAAAMTAFTIAVGVPFALTSDRNVTSYVATVAGVPVLTVFGVACAHVLRRPLWIIAGFGVWFFTIESFAGRLQLPLPFTGYLAWSAEQSSLVKGLLTGTAAAAALACWAIRRDVDGD